MPHSLFFKQDLVWVVLFSSFLRLPPSDQRYRSPDDEKAKCHGKQTTAGSCACLTAPSQALILKPLPIPSCRVPDTRHSALGLYGIDLWMLHVSGTPQHLFLGLVRSFSIVSSRFSQAVLGVGIYFLSEVK